MKLLVALMMVWVVTSAAAADPSAPSATVEVAPGDWPWWRGPSQNGIAAAEQSPPTQWSETENVAWRSPIVGRGHGSPTVVGDHVFLATADEQRNVQLVICIDRASGVQRWEAVVHRGGLENDSGRTANEKSSLASSTVASDGHHVFINFLNDNAVWTTALDFDGNLIWQQRVSDYQLHQGYGSSPAIYRDLVLVSADNKGGGAVAGLDRRTGEIRWRHGRPAKPNYASPIVVHVDGRDQLILTGCDLVTSLDPNSGKVLWEIDGATTECVTSTVTDGTHIFTSGGYPKNHLAAVVADGSGRVAWETNTRVYVPSLLQRDGFLYATLDAGIASCVRCDTGEEVWKARLGGTFTSSPVMVGDLIYATNEDGVTFIFRADPQKYSPVAENKLGSGVYATPAICAGQIFTRVAHDEDGRRQEYLYCIGKR